MKLFADHCDCLIRAHAFKERNYSEFPTPRNVLLQLISDFPWTPVNAMSFDHVLCVLALGLSGSSIDGHCSIREGELGANCDTKASKDSDPTNKASDGSQLQPKAQTD